MTLMQHNAAHPETRRLDDPASARTNQLRSRGSRNDKPMSIAIHPTAYDPADHRPAPRRYAWSVFAILFALMVVDYVDRQVVVSMFSHLKAQWDLSDSQLGALVSDRFDHRRAGRRSAVAACRPVEPRQEHLPDGARLEPRDDRLRVRGKLRAAARRAQRRRRSAKPRTARSARRCSRASFRCGCAVRCSARFLAAGMIGSVLGVVLGGFIAERWGWQAGFGAVGVPGLAARVVFLLIVRDYKTVALPAKDTRAQAPAVRARRRRRAAAAAHGARHVHRRRIQPARGLDDLGMAAELLQPLLRPRPRPGGAQDGPRRADRRPRRARSGASVADRLSARHPHRPAARPGGRRGADDGVHVRGVRGRRAGPRAVRADRRGRTGDGGQRRPDRRRRDRRRSTRACARRPPRSCR